MVCCTSCWSWCNTLWASWFLVVCLSDLQHKNTWSRSFLQPSDPEFLQHTCRYIYELVHTLMFPSGLILITLMIFSKRKKVLNYALNGTNLMICYITLISLTIWCKVSSNKDIKSQKEQKFEIIKHWKCNPPKNPASLMLESKVRL